MSDFNSTPYDGHHSFSDPTGSDWRANPWEREVSYGNFAGPLNRAWEDHTDPNTTDPKYAPIDGIDAAAKTHDLAYARDLGGADDSTWPAINAVAGDDKQLDANVRAEMAQNGDKYSPDAQRYAQGVEGFFGGRATTVDAIGWAGQKADEVGHGLSSAVDDAKGWSSLGDAGKGLAGDVEHAGSWLAGTAGEALGGAEHLAQEQQGLGITGTAAEVVGAGTAVYEGGKTLAGEAWNGVKSLGGDVAKGASELWSWL